MAALTGDWEQALKPEFGKEYYRDLFKFVKDEYSSQTIYPPADDIFNAFSDPALSDEKEKTKIILNPYVYDLRITTNTW